MAQKGLIDAYVNALPNELRYPIRQAFYYVMDQFRIGVGARAENGQFYRFESTTATTANAEFVIRHALGVIPTQILPVLDVTVVNSQMPVLQVSRAADVNNVYLKSASTGVVFTVLIEA